MSQAKMIAMERAEGLLKAAGVGYAIRLEDGTVRGTLALAPEKSPRSAHVKVNNFVRDFDYITALKALNPGDTTDWMLTSRDQAVAFQKVVSATAGRMWGRDNYITTVAANAPKLEVLRVA